MWQTFAVLNAGAQALTDSQRDAAEQRRIQERDAQLREQQEKASDARLTAPSIAAQRLPESESPCFPIRLLTLRAEGTEPFGWVLDSLAGPDKADSPVGKCLGTQGISIVLERAQNALVARGFVTSRALTEPQDISKGTLMLTVVPGRVRAVRFADKNGKTMAAPTSLATAVTAQPGDILNLRNVEQALENFKRVPTADADIQITPADRPDHSDLVIAYQSTTPVRLSLALDDSGGKSTGRYQSSATFSWDNPLGLNDLFYVSQNHDAGGGDPGPRGTQGYAVHYSIWHHHGNGHHAGWRGADHDHRWCDHRHLCGGCAECGLYRPGIPSRSSHGEQQRRHWQDAGAVGQ